MIPLVAPCITNHDRHYLSRRINNGLLESESEVRRFEEAFAEYVGAAGAVAVCSGTAAIEVALAVMNIDVAAIPTYSCVALRNATIDRTYLDSEYDVPTAQLLIIDECNHMIVPHMFGKPTQIRPQGHRSHSPAQTVEDWTLSLGGIPKLSEGATGVCSTHHTKMISTGRGGILFSNNPDIIEQAHDYAHYETHTNHATSVAMSSTQAALGNSQLEQLPAFIDRRREIANHYTKRFAAAGIECPNDDCGSVFFRYIIATTNPTQKVSELADRGIEAGRGVNPLLHQLEQQPDTNYPGAINDWNRLLSVPIHPTLTDLEATYIAEKVLEVCAP